MSSILQGLPGAGTTTIKLNTIQEALAFIVTTVVSVSLFFTIIVVAVDLKVEKTYFPPGTAYCTTGGPSNVNGEFGTFFFEAFEPRRLFYGAAVLYMILLILFAQGIGKNSSWIHNIIITLYVIGLFVLVALSIYFVVEEIIGANEPGNNTNKKIYTDRRACLVPEIRDNAESNCLSNGAGVYTPTVGAVGPLSTLTLDQLTVPGEAVVFTIAWVFTGLSNIALLIFAVLSVVPEDFATNLLRGASLIGQRVSVVREDTKKKSKKK